MASRTSNSDSKTSLSLFSARRYLRLVTAVVVGFLPAIASAERFDFEDLPARTVVNAQYGARGVIFFGAYLDNHPQARSGFRVLRSRPLNSEVFEAVPFVMTFTSPQARVAMHASNLPGAASNGTLKVFNASGTLLAQDGPKAVPSDSFNAFFEVRVGTASITRAELHIAGTAFQAIDDLVVEGGQVEPRPTTPLVVTITAPFDGEEIRHKSVSIRGTVVGDSLLDTMVLGIQSGLHPGAPPSENTVALSGTEANRTFSLDYGFIEGPYRITALATNIVNLQGSTTITVLSKPRQVLCPEKSRVVDIKASDNLVTRSRQRFILKQELAADGTTVRLEPDVELDFSELPGSFFPIHFGRCVTLTSVSIPDHGAEGAEARTPKSRGPVLKYGPHRPGVRTFLAVQCFNNGAHNDGARISGFRLIGLADDAGNQSTDEAGIRVMRCIDVEISNMEVAGWASDAISIEDDRGADQPPEGNGPFGRIMNPDQIRIHDNFLHHNQHSSQTQCYPVDGAPACQPPYQYDQNGCLTPCTQLRSHAEGYGVNVGDGAWAKISRNVFDFNRHAIAASGYVGGYVAEQNLVLKGGGYHGTFVNTYTHSFDVHGTGCWCSVDLCGDAERQFWFLANAFQYRKDNAIKIRGRPDIGAFISENIFPHPDLVGGTTACVPFGNDAINLDTWEKVEIGPGNVNNNVINFDSFGNYGVCDFDGDRIDDLFLATGATWWFSSAGEFHWTYLNAKKERLDQVRLGYFDGDRRCDVLTERDGLWVISSGGSEDWKPFGAFGAPLADVKFGRFDPNERDHRPGATRRTTHAFRRAPDGQWSVTRLSSPTDWKPVQSSDFPMTQLRFGDFTGDGVTDVFAVESGRWAISESATGSWSRLNSSLGDAVENLFIANMDADDNIDDILRLEYDTRQIQIGNLRRWRITLTWWLSHNGRGPWRKWKDYAFEFPADSPEFVLPSFAFAGRFGTATGGGTLVIDPTRTGRFHSEVDAERDWNSQFPY